MTGKKDADVLAKIAQALDEAVREHSAARKADDETGQDEERVAPLSHSGLFAGHDSKTISQAEEGETDNSTRLRERLFLSGKSEENKQEEGEAPQLPVSLLTPAKEQEQQEIAPDERAIDADQPVEETENRRLHRRLIEAILIASDTPVSEEELQARLPEGADIRALLRELQGMYATRGVNIMFVAGKWAIRTAPDLNVYMRREAVEQKKLSRAALETLAITAYHQPVTRAEIEDIRGVSTARGTLDALMEIGWVCMRGRRKTPGRPVTYGTTEAFLDHFGLSDVQDLPGMEELRGAGLLDATMPADFQVPTPHGQDLQEDEDPLDDNALYATIELGDGDEEGAN